jgi:hypothetical protein
MKPKFFIRLNLAGTVVFLLAFVIILASVNPFKAGSFQIFLFYFVLFFLIFGILNLLEKILRMPVWCRFLISATIIAILILQKKF